MKWGESDQERLEKIRLIVIEGMSAQRIDQAHGDRLLGELDSIDQHLNARHITKANEALGRLTRHMKREKLM